MTPSPRTVLVVEDDPKIADLLHAYLTAQGFRVEQAADGLLALRLAERLQPALVLLDLMLPGLDGVEVCRELRRHSAVPIIMVTARVDEIDRLLGLEVGADDYICKPFSPREVVARMRALLRRAEGRVAGVMPTHGFAVDDSALRIGWDGQWLPLTPLEFRLLRLLLSRPGHVFSRARLLDAAHADLRDTSDRTVDSHIRNLRRKIEALRPQGSGIVSVYGAGYRFDPALDERHPGAS